MSVFCGQCGTEYDSDAEYLAAVCSKTGFKPTEPESMGSNWDAIALVALERGESETTPEKLQAAISEVEARKTSQ